MRPKVKAGVLEPYNTPGAPLEGRCLYPFLYARVSFSGKAYFCPFIRIEVGDLTKQSLEEVWTGERYTSMRRALVTNGIFPVCRRCCKVELTPLVDGDVHEAGERPRMVAMTAD
jgi:MoaA/NifB/PqqE/SkfB family radical SAM enzyme